MVQWLTTGVSAVAFRGHSDVTVHGAQIPDQSVVCYGHRAVFRGNARRRARIELSDAACRTTDHALGTGVSLPLLTNIILDKAPFHKRGMMLGLVSLVTCAAPAIGPVFGGLVTEFLNWHWIFYA